MYSFQGTGTNLETTLMRYLVVPVLLLVILCSGCGGQRYLHVRIERDGQPVLETGYGVSDRLGTGAMWKSLQGKAFEALGSIEPDASDPQTAVLRGRIRIVILHVDREMASVRVDELRLVRSSVAQDQWELPPDEVQRTARAAGL
jgi:hypothetical protein